MRRSARLFLILALSASLFPGCGLLQKFQRKRRAAETSKAPQQIGTIVLVNTEGSFVLIDNAYRSNPSMGEIAQSRAPDGSVAQLRVTEIRKRPFVIADIVSGLPGKGDLVFQEKKGKEPISPQPQ